MQCWLRSILATEKGRPSIGYRRFSTVAAALKFLVEDPPPTDLATVLLEVDEGRYGPEEIRALYDAAEYPLARASELNGVSNLDE